MEPPGHTFPPGAIWHAGRELLETLQGPRDQLAALLDVLERVRGQEDLDTRATRRDLVSWTEKASQTDSDD
jgi:hypothetical protein